VRQALGKPAQLEILKKWEVFQDVVRREPKRAAAHRLLEEGLATERSKVELVFVDGNGLNFRVWAFAYS